MSNLDTPIVSALNDIRSLMEAAYRADWSNGVTDATGGIDEGQVRGGELLDSASAAVRLLEKWASERRLTAERVDELLTANTAYMERARAAEAEVSRLKAEWVNALSVPNPFLASTNPMWASLVAPEPVAEVVRAALLREGVEAPDKAIQHIGMAATFAASVALRKAEQEADLADAVDSFAKREVEAIADVEKGYRDALKEDGR